MASFISRSRSLITTNFKISTVSNRVHIATKTNVQLSQTNTSKFSTISLITTNPLTRISSTQFGSISPLVTISGYVRSAPTTELNTNRDSNKSTNSNRKFSSANKPSTLPFLDILALACMLFIIIQSNFNN